MEKEGQLMQDVIHGDARLIEAISRLCSEPDAVHYSTDSFGNAFHWFRLDTPRLLPQGAALLREAGARLAMITAYNRRPVERAHARGLLSFRAQGNHLQPYSDAQPANGPPCRRSRRSLPMRTGTSGK